jgi:hypothetical protein
MGPGVTRANLVLVWHAGQSGRLMIMMLRLLVQAGALQNSQSPVDTEGAGDTASVGPFRVTPLVNFAHFRKVNTALVSQFCASDGASLHKETPCECPLLRLKGGST